MKFKYISPSKGRPRPIIKVRLCSIAKGIDKEIDVYMLVDSGSDVTIIDTQIAALLGVDVVKLKKSEEIRGVGKGSLYGYLDRVKIMTCKEAVLSNVIYADLENKSAYGILGQIGYFEHHKITFNTSKGEVTIIPNWESD